MRKRVSLLADNMLQGISEQVSATRTLNHQEDRVNLMPSAVYGNYRRPSSEVLSLLHSSTSHTDGYHRYVRDNQERYLIVSNASRLRVYDLNTGLEVTVAAPDGWGYLACVGQPREKHRFLTAGDYTFVANREVLVATNPALTPAATNKWLVYLKQGDYAVTYAIKLNGTEVASFKTSATLVDETSTEFIATQLSTDLTANLPVGYTHTRVGSVIEIRRLDGGSFNLTATDTVGNTALFAINDSIQRFSDLPARAPNGYLVKVSGDTRSEYDDYYVKFVADDPSSLDSTGVWTETVAPGIRYQLSAATMPHILVREADGTFTFRRATWSERKVGGLLSAPDPSFVGQRIENMFFFGDRLGFIHGASLTTTAIRDYFNFFRATARTVLDTDPVDISAQTKDALTFRYAYPFERDLVILADRAQLVVRGELKFTQENASITVTSYYEMSPESIPDTAGTSLFFMATDGLGASVMEMQVDPEGQQTFAVDVAEHVPSLLPTSACTITASSSHRSLIVVAHDRRTTSYMYSWLWSDRERVLASWQRLLFGSAAQGARILYASLDTSIGYLIAEVGASRVLLRMELNDDGTWKNTPEDLHLDFVSRHVGELETTYNPATDRTTVTLPFPLPSPSVIGRTPSGPVDLTGDVVSNSGTTLSVRGEHTDLTVGTIPPCYVVMSEPFPYKWGPRGEMIADQVNRFQVGQIRVSYTASGPFTVTVQKQNRDPLVSNSWGGRWDDWGVVLGALPVDSGMFSAPVKGSSREITVTISADGFYPLNLVSAEWSGMLINKRK